MAFGFGFGMWRRKGGGGGPPPPYVAATRFNDNRNSQYVALIIDDI